MVTSGKNSGLEKWLKKLSPFFSPELSQTIENPLQAGLGESSENNLQIQSGKVFA